MSNIKSEKSKDIMVIIRFDFKSLRDEIRNSLLLFKPKAKENVEAIFEPVRCRFERVLEREGTSL